MSDNETRVSNAISNLFDAATGLIKEKILKTLDLEIDRCKLNNDHDPRVYLERAYINEMDAHQAQRTPRQVALYAERDTNIKFACLMSNYQTLRDTTDDC